jgi:hypothetical protein
MALTRPLMSSRDARDRRWGRRCPAIVAVATLWSAFLAPAALARKPDRLRLLPFESSRRGERTTRLCQFDFSACAVGHCIPTLHDGEASTGRRYVSRDQTARVAARSGVRDNSHSISGERDG